jgi:hypothetical protein
MSLFRRIFRKPAHADSASETKSLGDEEPGEDSANDVDLLLAVREVHDPTIAAELFRRKFAQEIPAFPKHFVAMVGERCAGYVHYTPWQGDYLCGGLCIDDRVYRNLTATERAWIRGRGGIAEIMMRGAHAQLEETATIWGYIGDKQAEAVDRRVGFVPVAEPYLFAIWRGSFSEDERRQRIDAAIELGPF